VGRARRLLTGGALFVGFAVALTAPLTSGCQGHQCDGDFKDMDFDDLSNPNLIPEHGDPVDRDTYETGPIRSPWLPFPHQRTYTIHPRGLEKRIIDEIIPYVSPVREPVEAGDVDNFTVGSGNIAELRLRFSDNAIVVHNDTCADYYLRVVVHAAPETDAGAPADAADASPPIEDDAGDAGDGAPQ